MAFVTVWTLRPPDRIVNTGPAGFVPRPTRSGHPSHDAVKNRANALACKIARPQGFGRKRIRLGFHHWPDSGQQGRTFPK